MLSLKDHGNYKFGYDINDGTGGNHFHKESGDEYGNKRGSYGILDPYTGQMRIVHYIADEHGFRVDIKSNEPGLAHGKDSAAAVVNGPDLDEHSDYSSSYGQRTPGYAPSPPAPLYLSSTSHHPSSKPYYLSSPSKVAHDDDHSGAYAPSPYSPPSHPPSSYPSHESYIAPKPKYAHTAAKSYYPKNLAYVPKYSYSPSYYPKPVAYEAKPVAYEAPSYSSSYSSPSYGTTSSPSYSYEPTGYPVPVHKATYSGHDADSYNTAYEPSSAYNVYGTRKTPYHASDLYSKSAEPILTYTKLSGYSTKKYNEKTKYYNEPLEHLSSSAAATGVAAAATGYKAPTLDTTDTVNTPDKRQEDEEVAASYRDDPKDGVIVAKPVSSAKLPSKLVSGLIGLTSYRNPYSIDTEYKTSKKKKK